MYLLYILVEFGVIFQYMCSVLWWNQNYHFPLVISLFGAFKFLPSNHHKTYYTLLWTTVIPLCCAIPEFIPSNCILAPVTQPTFITRPHFQTLINTILHSGSLFLDSTYKEKTCLAHFTNILSPSFMTEFHHFYGWIVFHFA